MFSDKSKNSRRPVPNYARGICLTVKAVNKLLITNFPIKGFERMSEGEHLRYDPKNGFTMHLKRIPDPFGNYKCVAKNENSVQDEVVLKLEESGNSYPD